MTGLQEATTKFMLYSCLALAALGCASMGAGGSGGEISVTYAKEVLENYRKGMEELWDENYLEAEKYFEHVRNNFQFSKYAALADLRIADADYGRGKYAEAFDEYMLFRKFHPNHPAVPYAAYKAALCYYQQMPERWFFLPPPEERDQAPIEAAAKYLSRYIAEFGHLENEPAGRDKAAPDKDGEYDVMVGEEQRVSEAERIADAKKKLAEVRHRLAEHEMYVAEFYWKHDKPKAVVGRLEALVRDYPGTDLEVEALSMLARALIEIGEKDKARKVYERLVANHPKAPEADEARRFLKGKNE